TDQWQPVDWHLLALIGGSGVMQLLYHASCIYAYRQVEANRIAATEYSGLMFGAGSFTQLTLPATPKQG
ncbi:hypothetical protein ACQ4LF_25590, partial [Aeromonas salmonicida]